MPEESQRLNVSSEAGVTMVELTDRKILDEMDIMQIGEQLFRIVAEAELPKVVLDFTNVAHLSSSALGVSGKLALCCIQPAIREIFEITRLNEIFTMCSARAEAISTLS